MTAINSTDGVFGDIGAAGATAAWNIANYVMEGFSLTHAGANLHGFGNLGNGAKPLYASSSGMVSTRRPLNAGVMTTQSRRLPKEDANQINKDGRQTDPRMNKRAKVAKERYQKLQPPALTKRRQSECPSPTTSSTAIAAT